MNQKQNNIGGVNFLNLKKYVYEYTSTYFDADTSQPSLPLIEADDSNFWKICEENKLNTIEQYLFLIIVAPQIDPQFFDPLILKNNNTDLIFSEFGGIVSHGQHRNFIPTIQTLFFLLSLHNDDAKSVIIAALEQDSKLRKLGFVDVVSPEHYIPFHNRIVYVPEPMSFHLLTGEEYKPDFSADFPAKRLETKLSWEDLVLDHDVYEEIEEINHWLEYGDKLLYEIGLEKKIRKGYRTLFYGPPGTGKTLTASLIGKSNQMDVYRVDLSQVVSKYIGETEKNLSKLFDMAENKNWILFFDEADALFGKRSSSTKDSKDRYANQEVAYLLQRIEDFNGVIILATNLKSNIDDAFARRFQSMIYFPAPNAGLRFELWKKAFPNTLELPEDKELRRIAREFTITGGSIINVVRTCALQAVSNHSLLITIDSIKDGISRELRKEGKTI